MALAASKGNGRGFRMSRMRTSEFRGAIADQVYRRKRLASRLHEQKPHPH
jgi:hypothetical protein